MWAEGPGRSATTSRSLGQNLERGHAGRSAHHCLATSGASRRRRRAVSAVVRLGSGLVVGADVCVFRGKPTTIPVSLDQRSDCVDRPCAPPGIGGAEGGGEQSGREPSEYRCTEPDRPSITPATTARHPDRPSIRPPRTAQDPDRLSIGIPNTARSPDRSSIAVPKSASTMPRASPRTEAPSETAAPRSRSAAPSCGGSGKVTSSSGRWEPGARSRDRGSRPPSRGQEIRNQT